MFRCETRRCYPRGPTRTEITKVLSEVIRGRGFSTLGKIPVRNLLFYLLVSSIARAVTA